MVNPNFLFGEALNKFCVLRIALEMKKENQNICLDSEIDIWILQLLCVGGQYCCSNEERSLLIPTPSLGKDGECFKFNGISLGSRVSQWMIRTRMHTFHLELFVVKRQSNFAFLFGNSTKFIWKHLKSFDSWELFHSSKIT